MKHHPLLSLLLLSVCMFAPAVALADDAKAPATRPAIERTSDVIYGRKFGTALTMEVFKPAQPNGKGIIFVVSGGWYSSPGAAALATRYAPALDRGYTIFAAVHGSQPKFHIPEIVSDIHRAVRFVRHNAKKWEIDPNQIGLTGMSAGGHLTLMVAAQGGPGDPKAADPIDRESSAVQAAVAFFPPTDFLNYGKPGADAVGVGILKDFHGAFGPAVYTPEERKILGPKISPVNFITEKLPPTLIIHGDADVLVPVQQARLFKQKADAAGAKTVKVIEKAGKAHGWPDMAPDLEATAEWFDEHLGKADTNSTKPAPAKQDQ